MVGVEAANPPGLSIQVGYHGVVRAGEWIPVQVLVTANSFAGDATVRIEVNDSSQGYLQRQNFTSQPNPFGPTYTTAYDVPIHMIAGQSSHVVTYVLSDLSNPTVSATLLQSGHTIAGPAKASGHTTRLLVGVLSDRLGPFSAIESLELPNNLAPRVVALSTADLPHSAVLLRAFDLIAIDDYATGGLSTAQRIALADYVGTGGALLLGTGASYSKTLAGLPKALVPLEVEGTTTRPSLSALPGITGLPIATGMVRAGTAWLKEGDQPLLVQSQVGAGVATLATFSFTAEPIANWPGLAPLLRQIVVRTALRGAQSVAAPAALAPGQGPIWGPLGFQGSVTKRSWFLMPDLGNGPSLSVPPLWLIGPFVAGYALVIGVAFLLLRRLKRPAWLWVIAPAVSLLSAGALWASVPRGASVTANQFSITYVAQGWPTAYRETFTAVRPMTSGDFHTIVSGEPLIAPFAVGYGPSGAIGDGIRITDAASAVDLLQVSSSSVRGYATEETVSAPTLSGQLSLANGRLKGQVTNASSVHLTDAVILAGTSIVHIGDLGPDQTVAIDSPLGTTTSTQNGSLTSLQMYPNSLGAPPPSTPLVGDRRISLLQLILGEYDTQSAQIAPTLIAWAPGVAQPFTIDGAQTRVDSQNLIIMPLDIEQATGRLPANFYSAQLVDASGKVDLSQYAAAVNNGTLTYDFRVPGASGSSGLAIHHLLPPGPFPPNGLVGPAGQPLATSALWDWARSVWVPISLTDNGAAQLPDGTAQPGTGLIRLRVASADASTFRVGSLWVEGSP